MNKASKILGIFILLTGLAASVFFVLKQKNFASQKPVDQQKTISEISSQNVSSNEMQSNGDESSILKNDATINRDNKTADATNQNQAVKSNIQNTDSAKSTQQVGDATMNKADNIKSVKIVSKLVSFGFQKSSGRNIEAIIIHTSYNNLGGDTFDFDKVLQEWKSAGVSPHYAIARDGTIYQLVADQNIAWHAGASKLPDGTTDVNGVSIGIEVINDQNSKFSADQYAALNALIASLKNKYAIKYVLGHDDIAPGRKTDPWGIEWSKVDK